MQVQRLDSLIWTLVYGGLLALCLAVFVARDDAPGLAIGIGIAGALAAVAGVIVWLVRTRLTPPEARPPQVRSGSR